MNSTPEPQRYRHRTVEVEAVQWTGSNADALRAFAGPDFDTIDLDDRVEDPDKTAAVREADHGTWRGLKPGDWVVRLDEGLYEFDATDFAKQYEPVPAAVSVAVPPTVERCDRYAAPLYALMRQNGWDGEYTEPVVREMDLVLDAVLAVADAEQADVRAAALREAADRFDRMPEATAPALQKGITWATSELRRMADETPRSDVGSEFVHQLDHLDSAALDAVEADLAAVLPQAGRLPYTHTDDDSDQLHIGVTTASTLDGEAPIVYVCAQQFSDDGTEQTTVYVRPERVEQVVTALRAARDMAAAPAVVPQPDEETKTTTPYPPDTAWTIQTHRRGTWHRWLGDRFNLAEAREEYERQVSTSGHEWAFRLLRSTTTFAVDAEHQPKDSS